MKKADQQQFIEDYKSVHDSLARYCKSMCYGIMEPEDLMSDCVVAVLEKYDHVKNNVALLPYMIGIANNIVRKKIRRQKIVSFFKLDKAAMYSASHRADYNAEINDLYRALSQLSQKDKELVILFEINGFSIKEIAKINDLSESAVKTRLHRSRKKLSELLNESTEHKAHYSIPSKAGGIR